MHTYTSAAGAKLHPSQAAVCRAINFGAAAAVAVDHNLIVQKLHRRQDVLFMHHMYYGATAACGS